MKTDFEYVDCEDPIALIKDNDPKNEAERVKKLDSNQAIKVENLRKSYVYNEFAVNDLSYAVQYGECFALLGVTGAGKTTTFKCLTGEEWGDEGNLSLGGFDLATKSGRESSRKLLGYCPQFDAIFDGVTVREHMEIFSDIKGIRSDYKDEIIDMTLAEMDLTQYANVFAGKLSGGNKRKL